MGQGGGPYTTEEIFGANHRRPLIFPYLHPQFGQSAQSLRYKIVPVRAAPFPSSNRAFIFHCCNWGSLVLWPSSTCGWHLRSDAFDLVQVLLVGAPVVELRSLLRASQAQGAELVLGGVVHKSSTLILQLWARLVDARTGRDVFSRDLNFRGDTNEAWQRAEAFLVAQIRDASAEEPGGDLGRRP